MGTSGWCGAQQGQSCGNTFALIQGNMDQERLKKQQELAAAALYQQLQHQQFLQLVNRYRGLGGLISRDRQLLCQPAPLMPVFSTAAPSSSVGSGKRQLWGT